MFSKILTVAISLMVAALARAEDSVPKDHSTVHVLFVVPYEQIDAEGMRGLVGGGDQRKNIPMSVVGDIVLPLESIHPISISIDGEFVGHSLYGTYDPKPIFVLPSGKHRFEFTSDVFQAANAELRVMGAGNKQYLIVKLQPKPTDTSNSKSTEESTETPVPPKE